MVKTRISNKRYTKMRSYKRKNTRRKQRGGWPPCIGWLCSSTIGNVEVPQRSIAKSQPVASQPVASQPVASQPVDIYTPEITIDDIKFTITGYNPDIGIDHRMVLFGESSDTTGTKTPLQFTRSFSDGGLWRILLFNSYNEIIKGYDYMQTMMAHIDLQLFLNDIDINKLPLKPFSKIYSTDETLLIFANSSIIQLPFSGPGGYAIYPVLTDETTLNKATSNRCSDQFNIEHYNILVDTLFETTTVVSCSKLKSNNKVFIHAHTRFLNDFFLYKSNIYKLELVYNSNPNLKIVIFFMTYTMLIIEKDSSNPKSNIITRRTNIAPISMIDSNSKITILGTNSKHIFAGNFICKILDYNKQVYMRNAPSVTSGFKYIGDSVNGYFVDLNKSGLITIEYPTLTRFEDNIQFKKLMETPADWDTGVFPENDIKSLIEESNW